jgi:hypothetical protein
MKYLRDLTLQWTENRTGLELNSSWGEPGLQFLRGPQWFGFLFLFSQPSSPWRFGFSYATKLKENTPFSVGAETIRDDDDPGVG